jgi:nucleotide-binding universal stress UspA family protein
MPSSPLHADAPKRILLATDLSCRCDRALDRAVQLARQWKAELVVLTVIEPSSAPSRRPSDAPSWRRAPDARERARRHLTRDAVASDVSMSLHIEEGDVLQAVLRVADAQQCDLIVTGIARDEWLGRLLLGSTVDALVRRSPVPVLVVRTRVRTPYRRALIASDLSEASRPALHAALSLFPDTSLALLHAFDTPHASLTGLDPARLAETARAAAAEECDRFLAASTLAPSVRSRLPVLLEHGDPVWLLNEYAHDHDADLAVIGTHGRSGLLGALIGSMAQRILEASDIDVLVVRSAQH